MTDDQIIDQLQRALAAEANGLDPRPVLLGRVHQELASEPHTAERRAGARFAGRYEPPLGGALPCGSADSTSAAAATRGRWGRDAPTSTREAHLVCHLDAGKTRLEPRAGLGLKGLPRSIAHPRPPVKKLDSNVHFCLT